MTRHPKLIATSRKLNLRRVRPPPEPLDETGTERCIARINDLTHAGRSNWFGLLAYLTFVMVTVLNVEDADFFLDSRQTELPLIGVSIPTFSFFVFAPVLGSALHVYLHLILRKCSEELASVPATYKGAPVERAILPWLLNDLVLRARRDRDEAIRRRPMDWLAGIVAFVLIWCATPLMLVYTWGQSLPAHDEGLSALISLCTFFALYASVSSWVKMRGDLARPQSWQGLKSFSVLAATVFLLAAHLVLTVLLTEGGLDRLVDRAARPAWAAAPRVAKELDALAALPLPGWLRSDGLLVPAQLSEVQFSAFPPEQADPMGARHRFRSEWCVRTGLDGDVCGRAPSATAAPPPGQAAARTDWCLAHGLPEAECPIYFQELDAEFRREWSRLRKANEEALPKPDLRGRDLRRADLTNASLTGIWLTYAHLSGADLTGAEMQGAVLSGADLQGARLEGAQLPGAVLRDARMQNAVLSNAQMRGAILDGAQLQGAVLARAQMQGASLDTVHMQGADLSGAQMQGARLHAASLQGATLDGAQLQGADLANAELQGASLRYASLQAATLRNAQMQMADLASAQLQGAVLTGALMRGAYLRGGQLQGAILTSAKLQGAILSGTELERANLFLTELSGAIIGWAQLRSANWTAVHMEATIAHGADLRGGTNLQQDSLSLLTGDATTLLPDDPGSYVCTCWQQEPPGWINLLQALRRYSVDGTSLRRGVICPDGAKPQKTGTPWPLEQPPPWGNFGSNSVEAGAWAAAQDTRGDCP
ncbi:pentapeptide repeat-containing protein [Poseidonocella sp. HB161398]|uniref:pentapeptide repeat-containing protein n=1 Tax=Poseidonocella sp. HB161398 TaxID=2320855 RepID=UPI00110811B1|nr:pentapeptide repeat-containing protein [Poseidonocella sp. HB161398]